MPFFVRSATREKWCWKNGTRLPLPRSIGTAMPAAISGVMRASNRKCCRARKKGSGEKHS